MTIQRADSYVPEIAVREFPNLSPQQKRIVEMVCQGWENKRIASALGVSPRTVQTHMHNIFSKTTVRTRSQLTAEYRKWEANQVRVDEQDKVDMRGQYGEAMYAVVHHPYFGAILGNIPKQHRDRFKELMHFMGVHR